MNIRSSRIDVRKHPPPPERPGSAPLVAVSAHHFTLPNLSQQPRHRARPDEGRNVSHLVTLVVKLQHHDVSLSAVNARILHQVTSHNLLIQRDLRGRSCKPFRILIRLRPLIGLSVRQNPTRTALSLQTVLPPLVLAELINRHKLLAPVAALHARRNRIGLRPHNLRHIVRVRLFRVGRSDRVFKMLRGAECEVGQLVLGQGLRVPTTTRLADVLLACQHPACPCRYIIPAEGAGDATEIQPSLPSMRRNPSTPSRSSSSTGSFASSALPFESRATCASSSRSRAVDAASCRRAASLASRS